MKPVLLAVMAMALAFPARAQEADTEDTLQQQIEALIEGLDSKRFATRRSSEQELLRLGKLATEQMQEAVEDATGEARIRLKNILKELGRSIRLVEKVTSPLLESVTSVAISKDGAFLYAAAFGKNTVSAFSIDPDSGKLAKLQTLTHNGDLKGAVALRLCDVKPLAVVAGYSGKSVTLLSRNETTGMLEIADVFRGDAASPTPDFPIEAAFSPTGRYIYVMDAYAKGNASLGGVMILEVTGDRKLRWITTHTGEENCFHDVRGIAFHPTRNEMYLCASEAGTLVRASFDSDTGMFQIEQILRDGKDGIEGLSGAFAVTISDDGKYVYTSSGRFAGDSAVGVFAFDENRDLKVVQELISGRDKLGDFLGGNELVISGDGRNVYVTGTRSSTLAGFRRDRQTGELTFIETVPFGQKKLGPAGVAISPDGAYVYAAVEGEAAIAVFRRDQPGKETNDE